jgi:hypothetical protein
MFCKYNWLTPDVGSWFGIESDGDILIRPEDLRINEKDGEKGIIEKISFWGSFYEAEILVKHLKIVVRLMKHERIVGDEVFLEISTPGSNGGLRRKN